MRIINYIRNLFKKPVLKFKQIEYYITEIEVKNMVRMHEIQMHANPKLMVKQIKENLLWQLMKELEYHIKIEERENIYFDKEYTAKILIAYKK